MQPIHIEPSKLRTSPSNPRAIRDNAMEKLMLSIAEDPELMEARPLIVNDRMEVLAGNQRLRACIALEWPTVPCVVVDWDEAKQRRAMIKDNVSAGEWDYDMLANEWDADMLEVAGLNLWQPDLDADSLSDDFSLADGDKPPFQSLTFTLADEQAEFIRNALSNAKTLDEFNYIEKMGNNNQNGNALYFLVCEWDARKK